MLQVAMSHDVCGVSVTGVTTGLNQIRKFLTEEWSFGMVVLSCVKNRQTMASPSASN